MTRAELLAALERERICGDPALLMHERYAPRVAERVAGYYTPPLPQITEEQAARNRWLLSTIPDRYNNGDPEGAGSARAEALAIKDTGTPTRKAA